MEITENHAASSSQLHLQAVWHVAKLQVHGWGQVAIKFEVLWDNVTLHKDDEESEVHARSPSSPAMQRPLLKLLAQGCEHRHPAVLDLGLATPASAQCFSNAGKVKVFENISNRSSYCPPASACRTQHQHQPSLLKTSTSLSLERPRGSQKPRGAWSPTRPSKPQYDVASCRKLASAKFKYTAVHSSNLTGMFS